MRGRHQEGRRFARTDDSLALPEPINEQAVGTADTLIALATIDTASLSKSSARRTS